MGQPSGERLTRTTGGLAAQARRLTALVVVAALAGGCASTSEKPAATPPTTIAAGLVAPRTSYGEDAAYFQDLAKADSALTSYVDSAQQVALQALLTDGSAFCAFLQRSDNVDDAMASVVIGAKSVQSKTRLPASVKTFNAIDAVALVDLCPREQKLLPAVDQAHISALATSLSARPSRPSGS